MATSSSSESLATCTECGAPIPPGAERCWLCRGKGFKESPGDSKPDSPAAVHLTRTFSLSTMFLVTTLIAVIMGVATIAPGLAIALAIVSLPASLRTIGIVHRRKRSVGQSLSVPEKVGAFLTSLGIVLVIAIGAYAAFAAVCFPLGLGLAELPVGGGEANEFWFVIPATIAGIAAGGVAGYFLIRKLWRPKD